MTNVKSSKHSTTPTRLLRILTLGSFTIIFLSQLNPVNSKLQNLIFLASLFGAWLGLLILNWQRKPVRVAALLLPLLVIVPCLLPGRTIDRTELQKEYIRRLVDFEGTNYYWGGESGRGIDCSGLPRRAFRDALLSYGLRNFNGRAIRGYVEQWWFDASAKALGEGYRNYTIPLETAGTIQTMNFDDLVPGDLAVTTIGVHILAYVGNEQWIQADPVIGSVQTLNGRSDKNHWFDLQVSTHRWRFLAE